MALQRERCLPSSVAGPVPLPPPFSRSFVAMRCYSHLSDTTDWSGQAVPFDRRDCQSDRPPGASARLSRNKLPSGRYSPLHAAGPINCAGGVKRGRRDRALRTFVVDRLAEGWTRSNFRLAQAERTSPAAWVARRSTPSSTGQRNRPSSYGVTSRAITNAAARADRTFARYHQGSRLHPRRPKHVEARPRAATGRVTSSL